MEQVFGASFLETEKVHIIAAACIVVGALVLGWLLKHAVDRYIRRQSARGTMDPGVRTKMQMSGKLVLVFVYFLGLALAIFQFPRARAVGTGLLASAGVIGVVMGLASQGALANVVAGITLAFSQPFRLGDTIFVEEEQGTVEEIHLSYTFIRTPDNRRLIIPNRILASKAIVNYSIVESRITARVDIWVSYLADIEQARAVAIQGVMESPYMDKEEQPTVTVAEMTESAVRLRVLADAHSQRQAANLGNDARERILTKFREQGILFPGQTATPGAQPPPNPSGS